MTNGYNTPIGVPIGLPSILSLGLPPLVNPYPTLNLDFIQNPQFDSRITFSRGSQATLFDSTGTLRYAKHNLATYSQEPSDAAWNKTRASITADTIIAPDGTLTGDKLVEDTTASNTHRTSVAAISIVSGFSYTWSIYLKAGERTFAFVALHTGSSGNAFTTLPSLYVNLLTGEITNASATVTASSAVDVGDGWWRVSISATATLTTTNNPAIFLATASGTNSYTGDGTSGLYLWGAQLNLANMEGGVTSSLTTYYPTTTAAYYAPRFDYNPSTLQPRGLLIEEQRTNSILQSEDFSTTWVATAATVTANAIVAPSGVTTADKMIVDNGVSSSSSSLRQEVTKAASAITYTLSMFAKKDEVNGLRVIPRDTATSANNVDARFNLDAGTVISVTAAGTFTNASAAIQNAGNGWYRCSVTFTSGTETSIRNQIFQLKNAATFTGNGTDGIYIWGYQFEAGAFATSYIPTTTTALTRNADVATMTGTNFSSWYNASEGTLFAIGSVQRGFREIVGVSEGVGNDRIVIQTGSSSGQRIIVTTLGVQQALQSGSYTLGQTGKFAAAYATNSAIISVNGGISTEGTSVTVPTVTTLNIGNTSNSTGQISGYIQRLAYYPTRLPNATLQALTA